jgi:LmbE family N-acetylglucosaminyl deacetylase
LLSSSPPEYLFFKQIISALKMEKNMATYQAHVRGSGSLALQPLMRRTLVIVAHPDDETVSCGTLLQRVANPMVVFCTDGTPDSPYFWGSYDSREAYRNLRRTEAMKALRIAGVNDYEFLDGNNVDSSFRDQYLYRVLPEAMKALEQTLLRFRPDALLAPAYEGGHPDHDCCSFLASKLGQKYGIPVWEMPLYHRCASDLLVCQRFLGPRGTEINVHPEATELRTKKQMIDAYQSQTTIWSFVRPRLIESYRPQAEYDYRKPPHLGTLNYEAWQWPITGADVCNAFSAYQSSATDLQSILARAAARSG